MIGYLGSDIRDVTPSEAEQLMADVQEEWQRQFNPAHADHLANLITNGAFLATGSVVMAKVNGGRRNANGRHTLPAIVQAGKAVRCNVEWFTCDTDADYVKLFHAYDTENRKRTYPDSAKAFLMGRPDELPDVQPRMLNMFRSGLEFAGSLKPGQKAKLTRHERFNAVTRYRAEFDLYVWLDAQKECRELLDRTPVVAAVIMTYGANPTQCRDFWRQVVTGFYDCRVSNRKYPPRALNRFLRDTVLWTGGEVRRMGKRLSREQLYLGCVRCWNAYMGGRDIGKVISTRRGKALPALAIVRRSAQGGN